MRLLTPMDRQIGGADFSRAGTPVAAIRHGQSPVPSSASVQCSVKLRSAVAAARQHRGRVAVLDVAAAGHVELDGDRRRLRAGVEVGDPDRVDPRAADDEPRSAGRVARVQQLRERVGPRRRLQRRVVAVDRLRPRVDRAPDRRLDQVGIEAPVGEREIERRRARGAVEVEVGELGRREAGGRGVRRARSATASSRSRRSSSHGVVTISRSTWCSPSAACSIDSSRQRRRALASVQHSVERDRVARAPSRYITPPPRVAT